jgi:hypothetical protein
MRTWFIAVALALVVAPTIVGVGCGGGGGGGASATAVPTDRPTLEATLKKMALLVEDLPPGFVLQDPGELLTDNKEAAEVDTTGRLASLTRLDEWGRLLGYQASYMTNDPLGTYINGGDATVTLSLSIFRTPEGAAAGMEWGRGVATDTSQAIGLIPGVIALEAKPMSFPTIGDETLAAEYKGTIRPQGMDVQIDVDFVAHLVAIRRGRATAQLLVAAIGGATPGQEVENMIRTLDERMAQALQ